MQKRYVIYTRVSTQKQGHSGLGLEAQQEAVKLYLASHPSQVVAQFVEVESGKKDNRPELAKALAECRKRKATLLIAKLDRLARNVAFIANLMESGVEFIACDNPHANRLMIHLLAAFAEHEREQISKRTKEALAAAKARGVKLGINGSRLAEKHKQDARDRDASILAQVQSSFVQTGSYRKAAERLNGCGVLTPSGGKWWASSVRALIRRNNAISLT